MNKIMKSLTASFLLATFVFGDTSLAQESWGPMQVWLRVWGDDEAFAFVNDREYSGYLHFTALRSVDQRADEWYVRLKDCGGYHSTDSVGPRYDFPVTVTWYSAGLGAQLRSPGAVLDLSGHEGLKVRDLAGTYRGALFSVGVLQSFGPIRLWNRQTGVRMRTNLGSVGIGAHAGYLSMGIRFQEGLGDDCLNQTISPAILRR